MAKLESWLDRAITVVVTRASGRTVAILSLALYPGVGLALPLVLGWSVPNLIAANLAGVTFAALFSLGWFGVQLQAKDRRHLVEWTTNLRLLSAEEFEWMVGELFRREGWKVQETGRQGGPDGNIDLELTKPGERRIVQCKRWTAQQVGVNDIRNFGGALLREGLSGKQGTYVTLSAFNEHARHEAERIGMAVIDGRELFARVERARRSEPCPICGKPMALGRSQHGWWLRCVAPGCSGKRDLGNEPGRATELLLQPPAFPRDRGSSAVGR